MTDNAADRAVLRVVYNATGGSRWDADARVNWLSDKPMAEWSGVTTEEGYVNELDLGSSGLNGEIPARLGELTGLKSANLRGNELTGCIPYNTRLRNALFQSYNLGRGPGKEPGWDIIILHALHDVLIGQNGLEALRTSDESLGWQDFLDQTYGLGLAPCPPPAPTAGLKAYNFQTSETDKETLLAVKAHFDRNGAPASSFESWEGEMQSESGVSFLRRGWRGVTLNDQGRVVKLWLDERDLRGNIPPQLGSLGNWWN